MGRMAGLEPTSLSVGLLCASVSCRADESCQELAELAVAYTTHRATAITKVSPNIDTVSPGLAGEPVGKAKARWEI